MQVELDMPLTPISGLDGYEALHLLVRVHGSPIGHVCLPVSSGSCTAEDIQECVLEKLGPAIIRHLVEDALGRLDKDKALTIEDILCAQHPADYGEPLPLVTVAVCTRDNAAALDLCLESATRLEYPFLDLLLIDNAPRSNETEVLLQSKYPEIRYVREDRPGLDWARNRAIVEAQGKIIAFTDDDVVIDPRWVRALVNVFMGSDDVMAVTGLVAPYEFETGAQVLFEKRGGFGKGFRRRWFKADHGDHLARRFGHAGQYGTGANMAFRVSLFDKIGFFDTALDVGTPTNGGGDLDIFFRVIKEGCQLAYEPDAVVFHRHRRAHAALRTQMSNWGTGYSAYLVGNALKYPDERLSFFRLGSRWFWRWIFGRFLKSFIWPPAIPRDLLRAELLGALVGLSRYQKARRVAAKVEGRFGSVTVGRKEHPSKRETMGPGSHGNALRIVDLTRPITALKDVAAHGAIRLYARWQDRMLGCVDIPNAHGAVTAARIRDQIADLALSRLNDFAVHDTERWAAAPSYATLAWRSIKDKTPSDQSMPTKLPADVSVSIVLTAYDRPESLRECLISILHQESERKREVIVVDNNPSSGLVPPVVHSFPGVVLVKEPRRGSSVARNAGICVSRGEIIVTTDDDVIIPNNWLEKLIAPLSRPDVMVVTGNILPFVLETKAQVYFENNGGLGHGFQRVEAGPAWFKSFRRSVPAWNLGATANAAFRSSIFAHPEIGMMDEALGSGKRAGRGADAYIFYKVLKAGYVVSYEPDAYVWHKHRRDIWALDQQMYSYGAGHVAYNITTLIRDHDVRALVRLAFELPVLSLKRISQRLRGWSIYPLHLILAEALGSLTGPFKLLWFLSRPRSRRRSRAEAPRATSGSKMKMALTREFEAQDSVEAG